MKIPKDIPIFGDTSYRGDCKLERMEQVDFYNWLKFNYPSHAGLFFHPKNEGKKNHKQVSHEKRDGSMNSGASDCIIPGNPAFVVELKRKDHTKSSLPGDELKYLRLAKESNCFVGIALGCDGLKEAFLAWLEITNQK